MATLNGKINENQLFRLGHGFNSYFDITRGYHVIIGYTICHHRLADLMKSLTPEVCHVVQSPYAVAWLSNIEILKDIEIWTDVVIEIFEGQAHMLVVKWKAFSISTVAAWQDVTNTTSRGVLQLGATEAFLFGWLSCDNKFWRHFLCRNSVEVSDFLCSLGSI